MPPAGELWPGADLWATTTAVTLAHTKHPSTPDLSIWLMGVRLQ